MNIVHVDVVAVSCLFLYYIHMRITHVYFVKFVRSFSLTHSLTQPPPLDQETNNCCDFVQSIVSSVFFLVESMTLDKPTDVSV